jgi:hypothetical protein
MNIVGPERFDLSYTPTSFLVLWPTEVRRFGSVAGSRGPKLYVVTIDGTPVYVGVTKQEMRRRLAHGWKANGRTGYYGYAWRHMGSRASVEVWADEDAQDRSNRDMETVEAETVFLIRQLTKQWPEFQTEIHFHASTPDHRAAAERIVMDYKLGAERVSR